MESIIIFDFDDTLFPTSQAMKDDYHFYKLDKKFENFLFDFLTEVIETKSQIYIITNAELNWVRYCFFNFMPKIEQLQPFLKIISATELVKNTGIIDFDINLYSKKFVFSSLFRELDKNKKYQLISIGDGSPEVIATKHISQNFDNIKTKMIQFIREPSYDDVFNQLKLLRSSFKNIFDCETDLELITQLSNVEKQLEQQEEELFRSLE